MTCYTRHLGDLLPANPTGGDKRALDGAIRRVLGAEDARCPEVWAKAKERREDPAFETEVRAEMEREA
jgi:hypothetical protein